MNFNKWKRYFEQERSLKNVAFRNDHHKLYVQSTNIKSLYIFDGKREYMNAIVNQS